MNVYGTMVFFGTTGRLQKRYNMPCTTLAMSPGTIHSSVPGIVLGVAPLLEKVLRDARHGVDPLPQAQPVRARPSRALPKLCTHIQKGLQLVIHLTPNSSAASAPPSTVSVQPSLTRCGIHDPGSKDM
jgi:hypothetical protein